MYIRGIPLAPQSKVVASFGVPVDSNILDGFPVALGAILASKRGHTACAARFRLGGLLKPVWSKGDTPYVHTAKICLQEKHPNF